MLALYALGIGLCAGFIAGMLYAGVMKNGIVDLGRQIDSLKFKLARHEITTRRNG